MSAWTALRGGHRWKGSRLVRKKRLETMVVVVAAQSWVVAVSASASNRICARRSARPWWWVIDGEICGDGIDGRGQ